MTKIIESNTILEVTDDKGVINLLINIKCIVILLYTRSTFQNNLHSTSLVFCKTNVIYPQCNTEAEKVTIFNKTRQINVSKFIL